VLLILVSAYAIHYGNTEIQRQKNTLKTILADEKDRFLKAAENLKKDTVASFTARQANKVVFNAPADYAGLAIGQRDLHRYYYLLRPAALHLQIYQNEITNPLKLLTGNFDLSFVLVYLFPLFIIALTYNLLSQEKELGTLPLVLSNPISQSQLLWAKLIFRFLPVSVAGLGIIFLAFFWQNIPLDARLGQWIGASMLYWLFWFGMTYLITLWQQSSAVNALSLLGTWLLFVVIIPTFLNLYLETTHSIPPRFELTNAIRDKYNHSWDVPKEKVFKEFFANFPQYKSDTVANNMGKWIYANVALVDKNVAENAQIFLEKIRQREQLASQLAMLSPAACLQNQYNHIAQTDLKNQLAFLEAVKSYHEKLKAFFYAKIYKNQNFGKADFAKIPSFETH
jgi:ABC-2 type transport system permease protein